MVAAVANCCELDRQMDYEIQGYFQMDSWAKNSELAGLENLSKTALVASQREVCQSSTVVARQMEAQALNLAFASRKDHWLALQ